jgi:hypothetical protein
MTKLLQTFLLAVLGFAFSMFMAQSVYAQTYVPRRIDGVVVSLKNSNLWPAAVMIDNDPRARPQASLNAASVVYETLAEGGIPRYMAIFAKPGVGAVGPVRSVRPYFAELAAEYRAPLFHAGGSRDGLSRVKQLKLLDVDALRRPGAKYFYRADRSQSTFNLFTNGKQMNQALASAKLNKKTPTYEPWLFEKKSRPRVLPNKQKPLTIDFRSGASYVTQYRYDRPTNSYRRYIGGRLHIDRATRKPVVVKNAVIMIVPKEKVVDAKKHVKIDVLGRGKAILLKDGRAVTIRWKKLTPGQRLTFTTGKGDPIKFRPGTIWIEVVPKGKPVTIG